MIKILMDYKNFIFFWKSNVLFLKGEEALILKIFHLNTIASKPIKKFDIHVK